MAVVEKIVQLHGGTASAFSHGLGKGSAFTIRLPYCGKAALPPNIARINSAGNALQARPLHLLVVDDNRDAAFGLGSLLEQQGHVVDLAYTAKQALDLAHHDSYDAFLLDIGLPEMDGFELVRLLRLVPQARMSKFFAVTGHGMPKDMVRSEKAGFHGHFTKPVDLDRLKEALSQISPQLL